MTTVKEKIAIPPLKITQIIHSTWAIQVLRTGLEVDVFTPLEQGAQTAEAVAEKANTNVHATEILLDALTSIALLSKSAGKYALSEDARIYLLPSSDLYIGQYVQRAQQMEACWTGLAHTLRTGKPSEEVNQDKVAEEFFPALTEAIFPMGFSFAQRLSEELKAAQLGADARVLDVAAGAATWSIPFALDNKTLKVDVIDFPPIIEVTKKFARKYGASDRFSYMAGNWRNVSWQRDAYDVVLLGHILHSEGKKLSEQLLQRCYETLKPGGKLAIAEFIANDERSGPPMAMLFGVNMLLHTSEGCVFTEAELTDMLKKAGFEGAYRMKVEGAPESPVMIAKKPG
ncbi:MAG TPA: methyltransferase [Planktothrix sp.]|jgi:ubiquinone/menaquinone biosynthesis C-methylase UbiE